MAFRFRYSAKNSQGEPVQGEIEANDIEEARKKLREQGLAIETINLAFGSVVSAAAVKKSPAPAKKQSGTPAGVPAAGSRKVFFYAGLGTVVLALAVFALFSLRSCSPPQKINEDVKYNVVKFDDLSEGDRIRKDFYVVIEPGAGEGEVKYAAQKVFDEDRKKDAQIREAMFHFYYPHQDYNLHTPIAVLRWNWNGSGTWDYSFSFERKKNQESINIQRTHLVEGNFVRYQITLSDSISLEGAENIARAELGRLEKQWRGKVNSLKADFNYKNYYDPFMTCEKDLNTGGDMNCDLVKQ